MNVKIAVLGATGGTGSILVDLARAAGHDVIAVARRPEAVTSGVPVRAADARSANEVAIAITGADAVAFCVGPRGRSSDHLLEQSMTATLAAISAAGVRRLVAISASGPFINGDDLLLRLAKPIVGRIFREPFSDFIAMEPLIRASTVDWTIVRPAQLLDGPARGSYRSRADGNVRRGFNIRRADLAQAVLDALNDTGTVWQTISVAS